nr:hypothetical protein [Tanacetum cinerariifolium]
VRLFVPEPECFSVGAFLRRMRWWCQAPLHGHGDEICKCVWILRNLDIRDLIDYAVN